MPTPTNGAKKESSQFLPTFFPSPACLVTLSIRAQALFVIESGIKIISKLTKIDAT
jgi:hypothetical protein